MKVDIHTMEGLLSGKCLPANMLVNESLSAYLVRQFEALHDRAEAAERDRDELRSSQEREGDCLIDALASRDEWRLRAVTAEAEIARRDAAASKPVVLPEPHAHLIWIQAGRGPDDYCDDVEVSRSEDDRCCDGSERYAVYSEFEVKAMLDAANIPYELKP